MGSIRIVGGTLGGRRLRAPSGDTTRPTSDRVREAIGSALSSRNLIQGAHVLELYAGTGALGFEMLSRGAEQVLFVEKDPRVAKLIRENATELAVTGQVEVLCEDVTRPRGQGAIASIAKKRGAFSLLLADPPYRDAEAAMSALTSLCAHGVLASQACLLLEHGARAVPVLPSDFQLLSDYRYGDTGVMLCQYRPIVSDSLLDPTRVPEGSLAPTAATLDEGKER